MTKKLPIFQALSFAVSTFVKNIQTFFFFTLIWVAIFGAAFSVCGILYAFLNNAYPSADTFQFGTYLLKVPALSASSWIIVKLFIVLCYVAALLCGILCFYQLISISIDLYHNKPVSIRDKFSFSRANFFSFAGARILYGLKVMLGVLLFIIPGFYMAAKYFFAGVSLIDKTSSTIREDTQYSAQLTNKVLWRLIGLFFVYTLVIFGVNFLLSRITILAPYLILLSLWQMVFAGIFSLVTVYLYYSLKAQLSSKEVNEIPSDRI